MLLFNKPDNTNNMKQNVLKLIGAIIIIINVSLWGYKNYNDTGIGRYIPYYNHNLISNDCIILDTKTGEVYMYFYENWTNKNKYELWKINTINKKVNKTVINVQSNKY